MPYKKGRIRLLIDDVPADLKQEFKIYCLTKRSTMRGEILRFMREAIESMKEAK